MVKRLLFLLTFAILPTMAETHYMEAEDFLGNARVVSSRDASGGKYLEGSTWYVFVKGLPIPALKKELHVFARMRSALPAHWFLAYDSAKPFGWFKTESSEWHWVRIGSFTPGFVRENGGVFPQIFLQKPVNSTVERTDGAVDVLVFSEEKITSKELEGLFRESNQQRTKQVEPPQGAETPDGLADSHRICSAHLTNHPPVIDGKLDDAAWHGVSPLTGFICIGGRRFATQQTFVRICRDAENLYLGAELQESQMNLIRRLRTRRNDQIWTDDSFEVFIDPGLTQKKAYHFIVNPNGARQDDLKARIDEAGFAELRLDWEAATSLQESGWTVELKIPFRLLTFSEITPQSAWGINFCRSEIPLGEKSYWNNTGEYFYAPAKYGVMFFAQVPGGLQAIRMPMGENGMRLTFMPAQETSVTVSAEIHAGERHETFPAVIHGIGPGETTIQFPVQAYRQYRVLSRVTEGANSAEFSLVARHYAPGLHSALWPPEERDNCLPILPGTAQHAFLILGNHSSETFSELVAEISVPEGIVLLDPTTDVDYPFYRRCRLLESKALDREEGRYTVHRIAIEGKLPPKDLRKCRFFEGITLFFQVAGSALHNRRLPLFHRILATNAQEEEQRTVLEVLEPLEGRQPRRLTVHNWMWTFYPYGGCLKPYLETMRRIGVNSVEGGGAQSLAKNRLLFREHNLSLVNNMY
ncbi:MAG: carbohydrate binding family 9 domain-containing protein, partial [Victivallales bacterium]|nr:carbohydrate binding family 9 domain-containing protein [Victivallales bacterium]